MNYFQNNIIIVFISLLSSCNNKYQTKNTYQIINDNFLNIVDTISYEYNTLRPAPNQPLLLERRKEYPITVYDKFLDINVFKFDIRKILNYESIHNKEDYINLLNTPIEVKNHDVDLSKIVNDGLYKLVAIDDDRIMRMAGFIGHLQFSEIVSNDQIALAVVSIQDNIKAGVRKLVLFNYLHGSWKIEKEIVMQIW